MRLALHEHTLGQLRSIAKGMGLRCEQHLKRHEVEQMIVARYAAAAREEARPATREQRQYDA